MSGARLALLGLDAVSPVDEASRAAALVRLDSLTKPLGALGRLEALAAQLCAVQGTLQPAVLAPVALVFAADHGVADRGVSPYPKAVTQQMVQNYLSGGAAISVLARTSDFALWIIDAGVAGDCGTQPRLLDAKIRHGTRDFVEGPAMTQEDCQRAVRRGGEVLDSVAGHPTNTVLLGEMGIGNTASAALLMHGLTGIALDECVGRGAGHDDRGLEEKKSILRQALIRRTPPDDPLALLAEFGGYEIAMLVGAILAAAARRAVIVIDGFTVTVAAVLAARIDARVPGYCVFAHCSAEHAHRALLGVLGVRPLLDLQLRLGEGSGAALALPLLRAAAALFVGMATFADAGVSESSRPPESSA